MAGFDTRMVKVGSGKIVKRNGFRAVNTQK